MVEPRKGPNGLPCNVFILLSATMLTLVCSVVEGIFVISLYNAILYF